MLCELCGSRVRNCRCELWTPVRRSSMSNLGKRRAIGGGQLGILKRANVASGGSYNQIVSAGLVAAAKKRLYGTRYSSGGFGRMSKPLPSFRTAELKSVDLAYATASAYSSTVQWILLNGTQNGAAFYNRVGNEIEMKSLHLIGQIYPTGSANTAGDYLRTMVIYDRQPNGANPVLADVLSSYPTTGTSPSPTSLDMTNPNNFDRFRILADIRTAIPSSASGATGETYAPVIDYTKNEVNINRFINLKGLSTRYKTSTGAIGDITSGSLLLMLLGFNSSSPAYQLDYCTRLRFID